MWQGTPATVREGIGRTITKEVAIELAGTGVRVSSIHPAYVDMQTADYGAEVQGPSKEELGAMHPLGHTGEPNDMA